MHAQQEVRHKGAEVTEASLHDSERHERPEAAKTEIAGVQAFDMQLQSFDPH